MPKEHQVRITSTPRPLIDADLMAQIIVMLGRELAARAETDEPFAPDDHQVTSPNGAASV